MACTWKYRLLAASHNARKYRFFGNEKGLARGTCPGEVPLTAALDLRCWRPCGSRRYGFAAVRAMSGLCQDLRFGPKFSGGCRKSLLRAYIAFGGLGAKTVIRGW